MTKKLPVEPLLIFFSLFLALVTPAAAQQGKVSGTVRNEKGDPLSGVSILIKEATGGVVTDEKGLFTITVSRGSTLIFSFTGYGSQEVRVGSQHLNIVLTQDSRTLSDVVVVGYGAQNKKDVTGAVSTIKAADLDHTNAISIDNLIQGKAAGVNVNTYTSQPGGNVAITIRGALSPNGSNSPLYVIDGLPITQNQSIEFVPAPDAFRGSIDRDPLNGINPNDIESVDILKDASATAIYGSAAANGVILITTKRGKEGLPAVSYNGSHSVQTSRNYLHTLNATQFETAVNEYGQEYYNFNKKIAPYGNTNPGSVTPFKPFFTPAQIGAAGTGTNYLKYIIRDGMIDDQNISLTGGNASTKVFTSFNYYKQDALLKNSGFTRFAGRINIDQKLGSVAQFGLGLSYSQVNNNNIPVGHSSDINSPSLIQSALQFPSDIPVYNAQGIPNSAYYARTPNPQSFFDITDQTFSKRILLTPTLVFNIIDGLKLHINAGLDNNSSNNQFYIPVSANFSTVPYGDGQRSNTELNNYSLESFASYDKAFGKSKFSAVAGVGYYNSGYNGFGFDAVGFSTDVFTVNNLGIASNKLLSSVNSSRTERRKLSQFTRLNYTFDSKYILQFTGRFDGTNNFPQDHLFGFFPGISGGWVMNQEKFLKNVGWLSLLKLRGGYGASGNESITQANNYVYSLYALTNDFSYQIGNQLYNSGFVQTQLGNPNLRWETDVQANVGVDFGFFNNRLSGSLDFFSRTAKDLLDFRVLPSQNAFTSQAFNVGSTRSKGVELTLKSDNIRSSHFTWSTLLTVGTAKAYWVQRNPAVSLAPYIGYNDPLHAVYGWKTDGLIRLASEIPGYQPGAYVGNIKYVDLNHDGKLGINDVTYLGNTDPKGTVGLNNTLTYKGIDFSFFFYGSYGYLSYDAYEQFANTYLLTTAGAPQNAEVHTLQTFSSFNLNGRYPGLAADPAAANNPTGANNYLAIRNGYFVRLKNMTLGYSLPGSFIRSQKFFRSARVYIDVNNLFFVTNTTGIDPEQSRDNNPYPVARTTAFGISAQF